MTNYDRGRKLEYAARDELIKQGYIVIRSGGSRGPFDLCAISPTDVVLVQVKASRSRRKAAVDQLEKIQVPENVRKEVWVKVPYRNKWDVTRVEDARS
jgi:Holliday junction resolvase